jgi:hypothetical protein
MINVFSDIYDDGTISLAQNLVDKFLPALNFVTKLNLRYFDKNTIDLYAYLPQLSQPYYKVLTSLPFINMEQLTDCVIVNIRFYYKNDKWNLNTQESYFQSWKLDEDRTLDNIISTGSDMIEPELEECHLYINNYTVQKWVNEFPTYFDRTFNTVKMAMELIENKDLKNLINEKQEIKNKIKELNYQESKMNRKLVDVFQKQMRIFSDFN